MTKSFFNLFDFSQQVNYRTEILAGFTVAMTMIPESLSFAILAGFNPLTGLYAAFIMGLITAVFGGRPGMVSGGAGATVVVLIALMHSHGLEYVFAAIVLAGVLQILVGLFKLGKFIRLVPQPVATPSIPLQSSVWRPRSWIPMRRRGCLRKAMPFWSPVRAATTSSGRRRTGC